MNDKQTYCFGRFLIDLPKAAELKSRTEGFMFGELISERDWMGALDDTTKNEGFEKKMKEREALLKAGKQEQKFTLIRTITPQSISNSRLFEISRNMHVTKLTNYGFEAYRWTNGVLFTMKEINYDGDKIDSVLQRLETRLLPNLRVRRPSEFPSEPGFCLKDGFIADDGDTPQYEYAKLFFKFRKWPDVSVEVYAKRGGAIEPSLLQRLADAKPIPAPFAQMARKIKTFRKGKHDVGTLNGEEVLEALPTDDGYFIHHFVWDTQGVLDSSSQPAFYLELRSGFNVNSSPQDVPPSLTDKEAIELYDAIVNSIRLRPTTPGKRSDAGDDPQGGDGAARRLALGTRVSSLRSCPESGVYECAADAQGVAERRVYVEQGRPMPAAFVTQAKRGVAGMFGAQEMKEVETIWTLVAHEKAV